MSNNYIEQPLNYWEAKSFMMSVLDEYDNELFSKIVDRVSALEGVEITSVRDLTDEIPGGLILNYLGEEYEVGYYPSNFSFPEYYARGPMYITQQELEEYRNAKSALVVYMNFGKNPKESFKLQLKLMMAMTPDLLAIEDESAEKILPLKWVKMVIESETTPSANDLYTIQAISSENNEIWLHTHGLCRCGITELEVLQSDRDNYNAHYNLLSTYASYLLDDVEDKNIYGKGIHLGYLSNNQPIVATCLIWTNALDIYDDLQLGNIDDRRDGHNSKTSPIFVYQSQQDELNMQVSQVSVYNGLWEDNPLFFISTDETKIRTIIAKERFKYVKQLSLNKDNDILVKIALPVDNGQNYEHIYFRLISFEGEKFRALLLQEPYADVGIHQGDEGIYGVEDISDWFVQTPDGSITPTSAYILEE